MTPEKIAMQIKAINNRIKAGKVKNVYSAKGKIEALKIAYLKAKQEQSWNNYRTDCSCPQRTTLDSHRSRVHHRQARHRNLSNIVFSLGQTGI